MASNPGSRSVARWIAGGIVCVLVVALSGLSGAVPAVALSRAGHWVASKTLGALFHIDGSTKTADSKVPLAGQSPADEVVQDDKRGYVVDAKNGKLIVFGKSTLKVENTVALGTNESPVMLQVSGGPYLVYRQGGKIVRLGEHFERIDAGGELADPIATTDGTVWVQRVDTGELCRLTRGAKSLDCTAKIPTGHEVQLVALDDHAALLDRTAGKIMTLGSDGLGAPSSLDADITGDAKVSATDAGGRLAVISGKADKDPKLTLVDTSTVGTKQKPGAPNTVPLGPGDYAEPVTAGGVVVVVNQTTGTIRTFDSEGAPRATETAPKGSGRLRVSRGEDGRVYVDNSTGTRTFVVDGDGAITPVDIAKPGPGNGPATPNKPTKKPTGTPTKKPSPSSSPTDASSSDEPTTAPSGSDTTGAPVSPSLPAGLPRIGSSGSDKSSSSPSSAPVSRSGAPASRNKAGAGRKSTTAKPSATASRGGKKKPGSDAGDKTRTRTKTTAPRQQPQRPGKTAPTNPSDGDGPVGTGTKAPGGSTGKPAPAAKKPDRPGSVTAVAGVGQAVVSWTKPANNGAKITAFVVSLRQGGNVVRTKTLKGGATSTTFQNLTGGTNYTASVAARNKVGTGDVRSSGQFTPKAPPVKFTASATANDDGSVTINWTKYPDALTYAISRVDQNGSKQVSPDNGVQGTSFTTKDVTPGQPVKFVVLAYKLLVQFGTATTNEVTPKQAGGNGGGNGGGTGGGNGGGTGDGNGTGQGNGSTPVNGLDYTDQGGGNIEICWTKPDYAGDGELIGYHITYSGGSKDVDGADTTGTTFHVDTRGGSQIDVQGITRMSDGRTVFGMHTYLQIQSNFMAERAEAPEVLLRKTSLDAAHVLTIDMHLHDHGSPTRLSVFVGGKMVYGPQAARPGDQVLTIPNVVVQKGKTVDVQVGSYSDAGGSGNVAKTRVTAQ